MNDSIAAPKEQFDTSLHFVRVTGRRDDGFVEFDFSVGQPEVALEMVLRQHDFEQFCVEQNAILLEQDNQGCDDEEKRAFNWSLHDATHHFRGE
ncbi:phenol hydroxylase [Aestuariibacter sp. GS-14]|uniref:phenol hydroxylase subunit n=1 Tax=Aestuariibacter sp. GS-14 TaxID=2590670 RepID=UPI00112CDAEB|nr:phenol hydroxylase subunit [Aestuariibacter sp. GS-14]TPV61943.1 phenol hydroxylase [Aestuariibacter sp. GS-14]